MDDQFKSLASLKAYKDDKGIDKNGILTDLYWSDPRKQKVHWTSNPRGISFEFNEKAIDDFHAKFNTTLILRAHQMVDGIELFGDKLITVFSAPNYGKYKNRGAVIKMKKNLTYQVMYSR